MERKIVSPGFQHNTEAYKGLSPMEVDLMNQNSTPKRITYKTRAEERTRRRLERLCVYCSNAGHFYRTANSGRIVMEMGRSVHSRTRGHPPVLWMNDLRGSTGLN